MTTSLRDARICLALSVAAVVSGAYFAAISSWWWVASAYVALLLAWCERQLRADHHRQVARHERARQRAGADGQALAVPVPCCSFWDHSSGEVHGPGCARRKDMPE